MMIMKKKVNEGSKRLRRRAKRKPHPLLLQLN